MKLNKRQRETLAVCMFCQSKLDPDEVGGVLETGVRPSQVQCERCRDSQDHKDARLIELGLSKAAELVRERARKAGVKRHYEQAALEDEMRSRNEQN